MGTRWKLFRTGGLSLEASRTITPVRILTGRPPARPTSLTRVDKRVLLGRESSCCKGYSQRAQRRHMPSLDTRCRSTHAPPVNARRRSTHATSMEHTAVARHALSLDAHARVNARRVTGHDEFEDVKACRRVVDRLSDASRPLTSHFFTRTRGPCRRRALLRVVEHTGVTPFSVSCRARGASRGSARAGGAPSCRRARKGSGRRNKARRSRPASPG
jgi:hypothetical protein